MYYYYKVYVAWVCLQCVIGVFHDDHTHLLFGSVLLVITHFLQEVSDGYVYYYFKEAIYLSIVGITKDNMKFVWLHKSSVTDL